jgi:radical SAM superfamily enzyme YgiQ (UPF0313 family)
LVSIAAAYRHGVEDMKRPPSAILYVGGFLKRNGYRLVLHHVRERDCEAAVREICADPSVLWVGFSSMTGAQVSSSAAMSRSIKAARPDLTVVWGGIHASLMPEDCVRFDFVDFVVIGEGEITALELSQHLSGQARISTSEIPGLAFSCGGSYHRTPDRELRKNLDRFAQDWSLIDVQRYLIRYDDGLGMHFITSRGCPHDCGFCYNQAFNRRRWRTHSVDCVVEQMAALQRETGIRYVLFDDDNFLVNRKRGFAILERLKDLGITCRWLDCRVDYIDDELLQKLVALGVGSIFVGWESGSNRTLKRICKGFDRSLILEKTRLLAKYPELSCDASAIIGFPWETHEDVRATISLALEMFRIKPFGLNFNLGLYVPYPGSPLVEDALAAGFEFPRDPEGWRRFDILSGEMRVPWLSSDDVRRFARADRYAKMLHVPGKASLTLRLPAYGLAAMAYARLHAGFYSLPFETYVTSVVGKALLRWRRGAA